MKRVTTEIWKTAMDVRLDVRLKDDENASMNQAVAHRLLLLHDCWCTWMGANLEASLLIFLEMIITEQSTTVSLPLR